MGKDLRLSKILDPDAPPAVIAKADQGLALGPVQGLEDMASGLKRLVSAGVDGVIVSPGQVGRHVDLFRGKRAPALLVRCDWTNAGRREGFPLPMKDMAHVPVSGARHAAFLGAHAAVATFYVGYKDDRDEADNLEALSTLAAECFEYGLPFLAEAIPFGERITEHNYVDSAKMACRMSLEAGADGVIVPYTRTTQAMSEVVEASGKAPVLLLVGEDVGLGEVRSSSKAGVSGVVLEEHFLRTDVCAAVTEIRSALDRG